MAELMRKNTTKKNFIALVCARGGSKGLPGKNIRMLAGRPLIGWSIKIAKEVKRISRVIVSTDSEEIARVAKESGAEVPFIRPERLARDDSPEWLVWRHALTYLAGNEIESVDGLVVIPATAPLRSVADINNCLDEYEKGEVDVVITVTEANRSPHFNMVKHDDHGYASLVISNTNKLVRRQDVPTVYDMTTVGYVVRPQFVLESESIFDGKVRSVSVPKDRAIDIDTLLDFQFAEFLASQQGV